MAKRETYRKKAEKLIKKQERRIKELRKRGYIVEDVKPLPKRIGKKEYERLQKSLTLEKLYEKAKYFDKDNQRFVSGKKGREIERTKAGKKGAETKKIKQQKINIPKYEDIALKGIIRQIEEYGAMPWNADGKDILMNLLYDSIARDGYEETAKRIEKKEGDTRALINVVLRPSPREGREGNASFAYAQFAEILKGDKLTKKEREDIENFYVNYSDFLNDMGV